MAKRHRWGAEQRFDHKTERQCLDCPIVKVTRRRQNPDGSWSFHRIEFWHDLDQVEGSGTPACEPVAAEVAE